MATQSSILAWRIPWIEVQSRGSQRVGHDWATKTLTFVSPNLPKTLSSLPITIISYTDTFFAKCILNPPPLQAHHFHLVLYIYLSHLLKFSLMHQGHLRHQNQRPIFQDLTFQNPWSWRGWYRVHQDDSTNFLSSYSVPGTVLIRLSKTFQLIFTSEKCFLLPFQILKFRIKITQKPYSQWSLHDANVHNFVTSED